MKHIILALTALAIAIAANAQDTLRIMTYNLRFGECASMRRISEEIKAQNPDFVALQEVDVNSARTMAKANNYLNFINELAYHTGMFGHFGRTLNFSIPDGYYGVGILSRHPVEAIETIELPNHEGVEPRVLLIGRFLLNGKKPIVFASTHLDVKKAETRTLQAQTIIEKITAQPHAAIVCGDFNAEPGSEAVKVFEEKGRTLCGLAPTYPSDSPRVKLDYIFGIPSADFRLLTTSEGPASPTAASDHLPVISTIVVSEK